MSATYATYPLPQGMRVALAQFYASTPKAFKQIIRAALPALVPITDGGWTGYGIMGDKTAGFIFSKPDGTEENFNTSFGAFAKIAGLKDVTAQVGSYETGGWPGYFETWLSDPNIATNELDSSRLLTKDVLEGQKDKLADLIVELQDGDDGFSAGFNFSSSPLFFSLLLHILLRCVLTPSPVGKVNPSVRDQTSVHPIWAESRGVFSLGIDWADNTPPEEIKRKRLRSVQVSRRLGEIVRLGKGDGKGLEGTYVNEANP